MWDIAEACLAVAAFSVLCIVVLRASPYLPEPDDYAYRASIVAMTDGHLFTLSEAQARPRLWRWCMKWPPRDLSEFKQELPLLSIQPH